MEDTTYLSHHGVLGQKWGVRRYQNADGSLTAKGQKKRKKLAQKFYRKNRNEMINKEISYSNEFDKTDYGKRLAAEYKKQIIKMETTDNWENNKNDVKSFNRAEEKYFRANGEYCARKIIEEYGQEKADIYANRGRIDTGKSAVEAISDEWWVHAY